MGKNKPKISVIIAAYNEEKLLLRCLLSLQRQFFPKERYEVIVVDNGSVDKTSEIAKAHGAHVYYYADIQGAGAARAYGISKAKGEIYVFIDADVAAPEDWLTKIDAALQDTYIVCVSGRQVMHKKSFPRSLIFAFYNFFCSLNNFFGIALVWGCTMAVKKEAYQAVGGMSTILLSAEDWDIALRLQEHFGRISVKYTSEIFVYSSARKEEAANIYIKYALDGIYNYVNFVVLRRKKVRPVFHVR